MHVVWSPPRMRIWAAMNSSLFLVILSILLVGCGIVIVGVLVLALL